MFKNHIEEKKKQLEKVRESIKPLKSLSSYTMEKTVVEINGSEQKITLQTVSYALHNIEKLLVEELKILLIDQGKHEMMKEQAEKFKVKL